MARAYDAETCGRRSPCQTFGLSTNFKMSEMSDQKLLVIQYEFYSSFICLITSNFTCSFVLFLFIFDAGPQSVQSLRKCTKLMSAVERGQT